MTDMRQQQAERYRAPSFEEAVDIADEVNEERIPTGIHELDRVLGGGIVKGSL